MSGISEEPSVSRPVVSYANIMFYAAMVSFFMVPVIFFATMREIKSQPLLLESNVSRAKSALTSSLWK